jgi:hypothetical protein
VHVRGDLLEDHMNITEGWQADSLYFPATGKVRRVPGQGSMTRDGGTIFLRMGTEESVSMKALPKRVGAYSVATGRTTRLRWWSALFHGNYLFGVPQEKMTRRGRYLVSQNEEVIDRTRGVTIDIGSLLAERGYEPDGDEVISGDGLTIFTAVHPQSYPGANDPSHFAVAVTNWGWQPQARASALPIYHSSKLVVDVNPDRVRGRWTFVVQRRNDSGRWETLPGTYKTLGPKNTRMVELPNGTYRVQVRAGYGYRGYTTGLDVTVTNW